MIFIKEKTASPESEELCTNSGKTKHYQLDPMPIPGLAALASRCASIDKSNGLEVESIGQSRELVGTSVGFTMLSFGRFVTYRILMPNPPSALSERLNKGLDMGVRITNSCMHVARCWHLLPTSKVALRSMGGTGKPLDITNATPLGRRYGSFARNATKRLPLGALDCGGITDIFRSVAFGSTLYTIALCNQAYP